MFSPLVVLCDRCLSQPQPHPGPECWRQQLSLYRHVTVSTLFLPGSVHMDDDTGCQLLEGAGPQ